ncbi:MAG: hypothetical protein JWP78_878 [Mucilaginibacter sp.]|nr:hypothetical protein [Mucilaginibacter sp.]
MDLQFCKINKPKRLAVIYLLKKPIRRRNRICDKVADAGSQVFNFLKMNILIQAKDIQFRQGQKNCLLLPQYQHLLTMAH